MAIPVETPRKTFTGNGSTVTYDHAPDFTLSDDSHLLVTLDGVATTAYTKTTNGVTFDTAPGSGVAIVLERVTPLDQPSTPDGPKVFDLDEIGDALDRQARAKQDLDFKAIKAPDGGFTLPDAPSRANKIDRYDASGALDQQNDAQLAARVAAELSISAGAVAGAGTTTFADNTARLAATPERSGQIGVQLDTGRAWRSVGTTAGDFSSPLDGWLERSPGEAPRFFGPTTLPRAAALCGQSGMDAVELALDGTIKQGLIGGQLVTKRDLSRFGQPTAAGLVWDTTTPYQITDANDEAYSAWPHITARYDHQRDQVVLLYTSGPQHQPTTSHNTYVRILANASQKDFQSLEAGDWSDPVEVYDGDGMPTYVQAFAITAGGDYIMLTSRVDTAGYFWDSNEDQYRIVSTDGGTTWTRDTNPLADEHGTTLQRHYTLSMELLSNGRLLAAFSNSSGGADNTSTTVEMRYSDDDGKRWKEADNYLDRVTFALQASVASESDRHQVWEPVFVETTPGQGFVLARGEGNHTDELGNLVFCRFFDYGAVFTAWQQTGIPAHSNPTGVVVLPDYGVVELLYGARGISSTVGLYQASATVQSALAGQFADEGKIFSSASTSDVTDFGYPWCLRVGNQVMGIYYDDPTDTANVADLFCIGAKITEKPNAQTYAETDFRTPLNVSASLINDPGTLGLYQMGASVSPRPADGVGSGIDNLARHGSHPLLFSSGYASTSRADPTWDAVNERLQFINVNTELVASGLAPAGVTFLGIHARLQITAATSAADSAMALLDRPDPVVSNQGEPLLRLATHPTNGYRFVVIAGRGGTVYYSDWLALSGVSGADHLFSVYIDVASQDFHAYVDGVETTYPSGTAITESAWATGLGTLVGILGAVRDDYHTSTLLSSPDMYASGAFGIFTTKAAFDAAMAVL